MKKYSHLLVLLLLLPTLVFGQSVDPQPNSVDSSFSNPTNLSDKKMDEAKNFVHQGQKNRTYKEGCAKINDCKDEEGFPLEQLIGKAYSVMGMFVGGGMGPQLTMKPSAAQIGKAQEATKVAQAADPQAEAVKPDQDKKPDYCMMISMAYEAVGSMIQQDLQKKAQNTTVQGDEQLQSLVSLQETHKARQKTATIQSAVYGGVTACYTAQLMYGGVAVDTSFILKMGGAAALTGLYVRKTLKHKKAAEAVGEVIASMDKAGKNCNPWTKSACFCSEPTSKDVYPSQFQEVCVLNKGNFDTPKIALGCSSVDEKKKIVYDKECKCKASNTCMKANLQLYNPKFGLGTNLMGEANTTFDMIGKGEVDTAVLDRATLKASAVAAKVMPKSANIKTGPLTAEQQKAAKDLEQYMGPQAAAAMASATPTNKNGILSSGLGSSAISKLPPSVKEKLADAIDVSYSNNGGGSDYSSGDDEFKMPTMPGAESSSPESVEVLSFAEKAISNADVSNSPQTPIFDIISNRYRRSGWTKLDTEGK
jgi:hypothetical protein